MPDFTCLSAHRRRLSSGALVVATLITSYLTVACGPPSATRAPQEPNAASSEAFFRQAAEEWDRRFNAADVTGLIALYSYDIISMPYNTAPVEGLEAQRAALEQFFAANSNGRHETFVDEIFSAGDWAIERSRYRMTYTPKATGKEVVETGNHVITRKRVNGEWLIVWEIWNTDQPLP